MWPLAGLAVQTPRLRLRYVTDELAAELAVLAGRGIHDPAVMPFSTPWTDVRSPELEHNVVRHFLAPARRHLRHALVLEFGRRCRWHRGWAVFD